MGSQLGAWLPERHRGAFPEVTPWAHCGPGSRQRRPWLVLGTEGNRDRRDGAATWGDRGMRTWLRPRTLSKVTHVGQGLQPATGWGDVCMSGPTSPPWNGEGPRSHGATPGRSTWRRSWARASSGPPASLRPVVSRTIAHPPFLQWHRQRRGPDTRFPLRPSHLPRAQTHAHASAPLPPSQHVPRHGSPATRPAPAGVGPQPGEPLALSAWASLAPCWAGSGESSRRARGPLCPRPLGTQTRTVRDALHPRGRRWFPKVPQREGAGPPHQSPIRGLTATAPPTHTDLATKLPICHPWLRAP